MSVYNIRPCLWGSSIWSTIDFIIATFPDRPSHNKILAIMSFFNSLPELLPCTGCQKSLSKHFLEDNTNIKNVNFFSSKDDLIDFAFRLRKKVQETTSIEYHINVNYYKKKLAQMVISENNISDAKICKMIEAPFIPFDLEKKCLTYLSQYTSYDISYTERLIDISKKFMNNPNFDINNKIFKLMFKRHKKCRKIMANIYEKMTIGKYDLVQSFKMYDTSAHQSLLFLGCNILHKDNLNTLLDYFIKKK